MDFEQSRLNNLRKEAQAKHHHNPGMILFPYGVFSHQQVFSFFCPVFAKSKYLYQDILVEK